MRRVIVIGVLSLVLLIGGCSNSSEKTSSHDSLPVWHEWTCDSDVSILWAFDDKAQEKVQFRLTYSEALHLLNKVYKTEKGTLYSNGVLAFRVKQSQGTVFWAKNDQIIGQNCVSTALHN